MGLEVGTICNGKVTSIAKYGAFVSLEEGKSGMVHISEISHSFVNDINEHLKVGQEVKVKVIGIDQANRINLSIKQALPAAQEPKRAYRPQSAPQRNVQRSAPAAAPAAPAAPAEPSFEDKLKQFLSSSEGRMADLNRNIDGKRGGRRRR